MAVTRMSDWVCRKCGHGNNKGLSCKKCGHEPMAGRQHEGRAFDPSQADDAEDLRYRYATDRFEDR